MTKERVDLYDSTYSGFAAEVQRSMRAEVFGKDLGQNSWLTADEFERFISLLDVRAGHSVLDVGCGSGGPALFLAQTTGCLVTGLDVNEHGVQAGNELARAAGISERATFARMDAGARLPFADAAFDAVVCIDAINHFSGRASVLADWFRVLRSGGQALYVDPIVVTGGLTNAEIAQRSAIGHFEFTPVGENERLIRAAGFDLVERMDVTDNVTLVSQRWHHARARHRDELIESEELEQFNGLQRFFAMVHRLSAERRLSRHAFHVSKPTKQRTTDRWNLGNPTHLRSR